MLFFGTVPQRTLVFLSLFFVSLVFSCNTESNGSGSDEDVLPSETHTDPVTGLMWETVPHQYDDMSQYDALDHCEQLILGGYDDWRLPNITELRSILRGCAPTSSEGSCLVSDPDCLSSGSCLSDDCSPSSCEGTKGPGENGCYWAPGIWLSVCRMYWSSSLNAMNPNDAWRLNFYNGHLGVFGRTLEYYVWCVRP